MLASFCSRLLSLGAVLLALSCHAQAEKRIALIIGNAAYQNTPGLANPVNDAEDMATALKQVGFNVILERDLNKRGMERAIARFSRLAQDADAALFFYAGHGMQHRGSNYLMPVDAKLEDEFNLNFELTRIDDVLFGLERARGVKVLVLDACRNNSLIERLARTTTTRDLLATRGLAKIEPTRGMVIAYATQSNQVAVDGSGRNSPFTSSLVKQIEEPGLEIGALFRRVAADVNRVTGGRQLPELSVSLVGEFFLNTRETDLQAWAKVRVAGNVGDIREFMRRYPASVLLADARQRLAAIEREVGDREHERLREDAARAQTERERLERERIGREQAERERLARERQQQEQAERERLERERITNELALRDRIQREEAAKAEELARLTHEQAERERAERLQAANEVTKTQTALLTPPSDPAPEQKPSTSKLAGAALVREIKKELKRVGCYNGRVDEKWATNNTKASIQKFAKLAKLTSIPDQPDTDFLEAVRGKSERVCPLVCGAGQIVKDGQCVAPSSNNKPAQTLPNQSLGDATAESMAIMGAGAISTGQVVELTARNGRKMTCVGGSSRQNIPRRCSWTNSKRNEVTTTQSRRSSEAQTVTIRPNQVQLTRPPHPNSCSQGDKAKCRANCAAGWQRACDFIARHKW